MYSKFLKEAECPPLGDTGLPGHWHFIDLGSVEPGSEECGFEKLVCFTPPLL